MKQHTTIARNALGLFATVALTLGLALSPNQVEAQPINYHLWFAADDRASAYYGDANQATNFILETSAGIIGWNTPSYTTISLNYGDYLYIAATDILSAAWGLSGYTSPDGVNWTPITLNQGGWQVAYIDTQSYNHVDYNSPWNLPIATVTNWIQYANTNNLWTTPVAGTALPGSGVPLNFGSLPGTPSLWADLPTGGQQPYMRVLFRQFVVPEPASMLALSAGLAGLVGLRRRCKA